LTLSATGPVEIRKKVSIGVLRSNGHGIDKAKLMVDSDGHEG
jgi:hypothetical protein